MGADGHPYQSETPGALGGHRRSRIYGRLDCPAAARAIARGGYIAHRIFFADETDAIAAGYRPCGVCMPTEYSRWRQTDRGPATTRAISDNRHDGSHGPARPGV